MSLPKIPSGSRRLIRTARMRRALLVLVVLLAGCTAPSPKTGPPPEKGGPIPQKGEPQAFPDIAAGAGHSCLLTTTGRIQCWGANQYGQLGGGEGPFHPIENGPALPEEIPGSWARTNVRGLAGDAIAVRAGYYHTCALIAGGGVQCWGWNTSGQLGDGTTADSSTAVHVQGWDVPASAIALGASHSCALLETGQVRCWGENGSGQLGDGTTANSSVPVAVRGLEKRIVQIAAGVAFTCALSAQGDLYCWGDGANGRFGAGPNAIHPAPVRLDGPGGKITRLAGGDFHLCAETESGEVLCWGALSSEGEYTRRKPLAIGGSSGSVAQIAAGGGYTCALTDQDAVKCWGDNYFGQLGDGTDSGSWESVDVNGATEGVLDIATGPGHVCALMTEGDVTCWGDCSSGQCGDSSLQWVWSTYTNHKYYFSMDYPPGWNVLEVPATDDPPAIDQVWFSSASFPPAQTDARADITLWITEEDPTPKWEAQFFDRYKREVTRLGNVPAWRISGTNKESLQDELVVIVQTGDYFIQAMPAHDLDSLRYFDQVISSLTIDWDLVAVPAVNP